MGSSDLGAMGKIFRIVFIIMNVIYMVFGVISIAIGAYGLTQAENTSFLTATDIYPGAALLIVCGIFVIIFAILGVLGAIFQLIPLLVIYVIAWIIIVIVQFISSILSFYYSANVSASAEQGYADGWRQAIEQYETSSSARDFVDSFQRDSECCGYNNATDWGRYGYYFGNNSFNLPTTCNCPITDDSCINITIVYQGVSYERETWDVGCRLATEDSFSGTFIVLGVIADAFAGVQILGIVVAIILICCLKNAKE